MAALAALAVAGTLLVTAAPVQAATPPAGSAGALDTTFGSAGIASISVSGSSLTAFTKAIVQPDNKILVGGIQPGQAGSLVVARLNPNGSLDTTFGTNGIAKPGLGSSSTQDSGALALQSDGKIIVVGSKVVSSQAKVAIARLNTNGSLDTSFNSSGINTYGLGSSIPNQHGIAAALQADGKVIVGLYLGSGHDAFKMLRFNANGTQDTSFGSNGVSYSDLGNGKPAMARDMVVTATGQILVAGSVTVVRNKITQDDTAIVRFNANGSLDTTFPSSGANPNAALIVDLGATKNDAASSIRLDSAGRINIVGTISTTPSSAYLMRLSSTGVADATIGNGGVVKGTFGGVAGTGNGLTIDTAGRILVAGGDGTSTTNALGVERLLPTGASPYDPAFGIAGTGRETIPCASGTGAANSIDLQPNQQILVAGSCAGALKVARLNAGNVTNLSMTTSTPNAVAGHGVVPLDAIPASALTSSIGAIAGGPLRNNPTFGTPIANSGFGHSGFGHSGFGHSGFGHSGFGHSPLSESGFGHSGFGHSGFGHSGFGHSAIDALTAAEIPLNDPKTWDQVLAGTPCAAIPLQELTLGYINDNCPQVLTTLTTDDIQVNLTPLRNVSLAAYALGNTPIANLPSPCTYIANQPAPCGATSFDPAFTTLIDLELSGDQLGAYYAAVTINVRTTTLVASPVPGLWLDDLDLSKTSFGSTLVSAINNKAAFVTCGTSCAAGLTLAQAQATNQIVIGPSATLGALIADTTAIGPVPLASVLLAMVPQGALPIETMPTNDIVSASPLPSSGTAAFAINFDMSCGVAAGLTVRPTLPVGFRTVPSTVTMTAGGTNVPVAVAADGAITPQPALSCSGAKHVTVNLTAEPGPVLGTSSASSVVVTAGGESLTATGPTVNVIDGATLPAATTTPNGLSNLGTATVYTGFVGSPGNVDYYSIPAQPAGSAVIVTLSHLPADYDLVMYGSAEPSLRQSGFGHSGFGHSGFGHSGFSHSADEPLVMDDSLSPATGGTTTKPELLSDVPRLDDQSVRSSSANRGTTDEAVYTMTSETDTTPLIVQVSGYNGASSAQPYILRVTIVPPASQLPCAARYLPSAGTSGALPASIAPDTQTLFLVNQKRLGDLYGTAAAAGVMANLQSLATYKNPADPNDPYAVKGAVLPVDGDPTVAGDYAAWDANQCSPAAANKIVNDINAVVDSYAASLTNLRFIVVVGNDEVIPFGRVQDLSPEANESGAAADIQVNGKNNAESAALADGFVLTDNPYGDLTGGQSWGSTLIYNPQVATGRLVETPADINLAINQYKSSNGVRTPTSSYNAAYDWMANTGKDVAAALAANAPTLPITSDFSSTWTAGNAKSGIAANASGFIAVNAHSNFNQQLSSADFTSKTTSPTLLTTSDLPPSLQNAVLLTLGCHYGLSVADTYVGTTDPATQAALTDWSQAVLSKGGVLQAPTGYGLGDTEVIAYSGRLLKTFAQKLDGSSSLGQALMLAKQAVMQVGATGFYDAKAMEEATFYGLPMYRLGASGTIAPATIPTPLAEGTPLVTATSSATVNAGLSQVTSPDGSGSYFTTGQDPQATPGQPIEPRTVTPLTAPAPGLVAHDAVIEQMSTSDVPGFDPIYSQTSPASGPPGVEAGVTTAAFPSQLQQVVPGLNGPSLVFVQGQFSAAQGGNGTGNQRNVISANLSVNWSNSTDFDAPTINTVGAAISNGTATFTVTTPSSDAARTVVNFLPQGGPSTQAWTHAEAVQTSPGVWTATSRLATGVNTIGQYYVQMCDAAGNCSVDSNKALNFAAAPVAQSFTFTVNPGAATNGLYPNPTDVVVNGPAGTTFTVRVDGTPQSCTTTCTVHLSNDGAHSVTIDGTNVSAAIPIDSQPPVVTVTPLASSRVQLNAVVPTSFSCSSLVQIVGCAGPSTLDTATMGAKTASFTGTDQFGLSTTVNVPYYVDGTAPTFAVFVPPPLITKDGTATFTFAAADPDEAGYAVTFTCKLDTQAAQPCTSPYTVTVPAPIDGTHTFTVVASDRVGNTTTKAYTWRIDTTAPMFTSLIGPADPTGQTTATFTWAVDDSVDTAALQFSCTLDGVAITPCTSTGAAFGGLAPRAAPYTFVVTATDPAGNSTSITPFTWHVYQATHVQATGVLPGLLRLKTKVVVDNGNGTTGAGVAGVKVSFSVGRTPGTAPLGAAIACIGANPDGSVTTDGTGSATCVVSLNALFTVVFSGGYTATVAPSPPYFGSRGDAGILASSG